MPYPKYEAVRNRMRPGDLVLFWGTAPLSKTIEIAANGPSHSAIVRQGSHSGSEVTIIESTIENGRNGVQTNPLPVTLDTYPHGSRANWYALKPEVRQRLDLKKFYETCGAADGIVRYDKPGLFGFLLRQIPILGSYIKVGSDPHQMVCSVWCAALDEASGISAGLQPWKTTPADLEALPFFEAPVPIL